MKPIILKAIKTAQKIENEGMPHVVVHRPVKNGEEKEGASLFGKRLRAVRIKCGMAVGELADKTGIHFTALYKLERGKGDPTWSSIQKIARVLGISTDELRVE